MSREEKAEEMFADPQFAVADQGDEYLVWTPEGHLYRIRKGTETCNCADAALRHYEDCKHVLALRLYLNDRDERRRRAVQGD